MQLFLQISYLSEHQVELMAGLELAEDKGCEPTCSRAVTPCSPGTSPYFLGFVF